MGFGEQLTEIIARLPETRQTLLFSATLPKVLVQFARAGLSDPVLIRYTYYFFMFFFFYSNLGTNLTNLVTPQFWYYILYFKSSDVKSIT